jgi:hypothetical protein
LVLSSSSRHELGMFEFLSWLPCQLPMNPKVDENEGVQP